jgi:hypothetical protein
VHEAARLCLRQRRELSAPSSNGSALSSPSQTRPPEIEATTRLPASRSLITALTTECSVPGGHSVGHTRTVLESSTAVRVVGWP